MKYGVACGVGDSPRYQRETWVVEQAYEAHNTVTLVGRRAQLLDA